MIDLLHSLCFGPHVCDCVCITIISHVLLLHLAFFAFTIPSYLHPSSLFQVHVPPEPVTDPPTPPTAGPPPTDGPPTDGPPTDGPPGPSPTPEIPQTCLTSFNLCYALDMSGSVCNRDYNINCDNNCDNRPWTSTPSRCQDDGFGIETCCVSR